MFNDLKKYAMRFCLLIVLLITACAPAVVETPSLEPVTLKVQRLPFLSFAPFFIAEKEGYFAEQKLQIEFIEMRNSAEAYPLLAGGDLDVQAGFGVGYLNAIVRGARIGVVAGKGYLDATSCTSYAFIARQALVEAGDLDNPAQLQDRTISFAPGTVEEYFMDMLLGTVDLTVDDVQGVDMFAPSEIEALESGAIDFLSTSEPWVTRIVQSGHGFVWMPIQELVPDFQTANILYGPTLLDENPDAGRRFIIAYLKAVQQYNQGKTERNLDLLTEFTGLERELLSEACWPAFRNDGMINVQSVLDFQTWAKEKGYLDSTITEEQFWDPSFIDHANDVLNELSQ